MKTRPRSGFAATRARAAFSKTRLVFVICLLGLSGVVAALLVQNQQIQADRTRLRSQLNDLEALRQQAAKVPQLEEENRQITRLREENKELVRLRGEVASLRLLQTRVETLKAESDKLKGQLMEFQKHATESANLRNQNLQLQGALSEQKKASDAAACIGFLQAIAAAKAAWAQDHQKTPADVPTDNELFGPGRYLAAKPVCPSGGTYAVGAVQQKVACSIPGHGY